jgi:gas vesicle protein
MVMNIIKAGGYIIMINELTKQLREIQRARAKSVQKNNAKGIVIGAGIGSLLGVAAGVLFAPRPGKETRRIIADRTSEAAKNMRDSALAAGERVSASAKEKSDKLRQAGQKGVAAAKESLKDPENGKSDRGKKGRS